MIEQFLRDPGFLDVIHPIGPDFCLFWKPNGDLLNYGWNLVSSPKEGHFISCQLTGDHPSWVERPDPRGEAGYPIYRIDKIDTITRANPEQNPKGVQRLHWVYLVEYEIDDAINNDDDKVFEWIV